MAIRSDVFMPRLPEIRQATTAKCPCCGSRQFVSHQSRRICTYCRSEQDGQPVQAIDSSLNDMAVNRLDMMYGHSVLRPEATVRIANELSRLGLVSLT